MIGKGLLMVISHTDHADLN